jgi:hypothetical protein
MSINDPHEILTPPLRLAPPLVDTDERKRVLDVLRRAAAAGRDLLTSGMRLLARFPVLVRAAEWLTRLRTWLRPASSVISRSGVALPVWVATTPLVQRLAATLARRTGSLLRFGLLATARLLQRGLSMTGQWGKRQAVRLSHAAERADKAVGSLIGKVGVWTRALSASRPHIRVVHDVSLVIVVARQLRALLPPQWRLAATAVSLLALGGHTRRWIVRAFTTTRALSGELARAFTSPQPVAAVTGNGTVAIRPVAPQRPNHPQSRHHR